MSTNVLPPRDVEAPVQVANPLLFLARACRKYGLMLEFIGRPEFGRALTGADVTRPTVKTVDGVTSYFMPAHWDVVDALHRLPGAVRLAAGRGAGQ